MFESPWHWAVVAIVAFILFFGWKQLPDMSRSLGRSLRIFKTEMKGMTGDDEARDTAKKQADEAPAEQAVPKVLPRAEIVTRSDAPRPRPRPAPHSSAAGSRPE